MMKRKAIENLAAAKVLLGGEPATNAATSRAYYAAYHATWTGMVEAGMSVPVARNGQYFPHHELPDEALAVGVLDPDASDDLTELFGLRVTADYFEEDVTPADARSCLDLAEGILRDLLSEEVDLS